MRPPFYLVYYLLTLAVGFSAAGQVDPDTTYQVQANDSAFVPTDTNRAKPKAQPLLEDLLDYYAEDSMYLDPLTNQAFLFNKAVVDYQDMRLEAGYIIFDLEKGLATATGILDSSGNLVQKPIFTDKGQVYQTDTMVYNFNSQKARIKRIITQEGEGYLHGEKVKMVGQEVLYVRNSSFTTCNLEHPHFKINTNRAKVIVGKKIVTGPAFLEIKDVPTPIFVPFGYFPTNEAKSSGFILPTYTNNDLRGLGLLGGGYFWSINDYLDATFLGDVYSLGGWALSGRLRYKARYKYDGSLTAKYSRTVQGQPEFDPIQPYIDQSDFRIDWVHHQDPKARPDLRFNAEVHIQTPGFNRINTYNRDDFLQNTQRSSVNLNMPFPGKPYNLSLTGEATQDLDKKTLNLKLPSIVFNVNRINPFERRERIGRSRWYERIGFTYNFNSQNLLNTQFDNEVNLIDAYRRDGEIAARHNASINTTEKLFRYFTFSPSVGYTERWYPSRLEYTYDTTVNAVRTDTVSGFYGVRDFNFSADLTTNVYGLFQFNGRMQAIRHVMTPRVTFSYAPDFADPFWGYYQDVQVDSTGRTQKRSRYQGYMYGTPGQNGNGVVSFNVNNTLEGKWLTSGDSAKVSKLKLLENFGVATNYYMARDEFNWDNLRVNARTGALVKNLGFTYIGTFDFYGYDTTGTRVNKGAYEVNGRALNHLSSQLSVDYSLGGNFGKKQEKKKDDQGEGPLGLGRAEPDYMRMTGYLDYALDWNFSVAYNIQFRTNYQVDGRDEDVVQTLTLRGGFRPTKNWSVNFATGWDFRANDFSYTSFNLNRDLHCWEMFITWVPFGFQQSYQIGMRIKASMFKDVKLERRRQIGDF